MSKKWVGIGIGTALIASLLGLACLWQPPVSREKLSVARVALPVVALTHVAEAQGYFSDEGVEVAFTDFTTGREALSSACAGQQDLAIAYTTPVVHDILTGKDVVILTALHQSPRNTAVVALASHGINEPADLSGKTVGVMKGTSGEFFLDVLLTDNGIDSNSVVRKEISIAEAESTLKEGSVDAVVAWNPYLYQIKRGWPEDRLRIFTSEVYVEMSMLVGLRDAVAAKDEAIVRFLRALARAQELFAGHPSEARRVASAQARDPARIEADSPMWNDFDVGLGLNHVMLLTLEQDAEWMRSRGLTQNPTPAFRSRVADTYLREVLPDLVTLPLSDLPLNSALLQANSDTPEP